MMEWIGSLLGDGVFSKIIIGAIGLIPPFYWYNLNIASASYDDISDGKKSVKTRRRLGSQRRFFIWIKRTHPVERIYQVFLRKLLSATTRLAGDIDALKLEGGNWQQRFFGVQPFTSGSYWLTLLLAVFYPFLFVVLSWVFTGNGEFAGVRVFEQNIPTTERFVALVAFIVGYYLFYRTSTATRWYGNLFYLTLGATAIFAFAGNGVGALAFAVSGAIVFAVPNTYRSALALAYSGTLALALAGAGIFAAIGTGVTIGIVALAIAIVGFLAFLLASVVGYLNRRTNTERAKRLVAFCFSLFYLTLVALAICWFSSQQLEASGLIPLLILALLPMVNSPWDWLSLAVTRGLLHKINAQRHGFGETLAWVGLDIIIALLVLGGITGTVSLALAAANALAITSGGSQILDLAGLFKGLETDFFAAQYLWFHLMLLSTLVPTLIHFVLASAAVISGLSKPQLKSLVNQNDKEDVHRFLLAGYLTAVPVCYIALPVLALYVVYALIDTHRIWLQQGFVNYAKAVAGLLDPALQN